MTAWWMSRSPRERIMLTALASLAAVLVAWYGVARPLAAWNRAAEQRHAAASARAAAVDRALAEIAALRQRAGPRPAAVPLEAAVSESAAAAGLVLKRAEADPAGGLQVRISGVPAMALFPWLAELQQRRGLAPAHLTVLKNEAGGLDVDATIVKVGP